MNTELQATDMNAQVLTTGVPATRLAPLESYQVLKIHVCKCTSTPKSRLMQLPQDEPNFNLSLSLTAQLIIKSLREHQWRNQCPGVDAVAHPCADDLSPASPVGATNGYKAAGYVLLVKVGSE